MRRLRKAGLIKLKFGLEYYQEKPYKMAAFKAQKNWEVKGSQIKNAIASLFN